MRLAVCAEMMFLDLPMTERVQRIAEAVFDAEIWDWTRHDIEALAATGAMFSSMTGYVRGDFGDGAGELIRTARESIAAAETLGCPRLNLHGTGLDSKGLPVVPGAEMPGPLWISAARTLAAALAEMGYAGTVGLEAWAADGDTDRALARFRAAFTVEAGHGPA
jgi:hydroxypyruvate isomerase